ncbi:MAG: hypothetical protein HDKAJFGB_01296 [Anaerolineae bacterium]|nr:hypothetical protein [Anaerolineae bacterium]
MRDNARTRHRHFAAAAERVTERRGHDRFARIAHLHGEILERFGDAVNFIPLSIFRQHPNADYVCARAEMFALIANHHADKILVQRFERGLRDLDDIVVQRVHLGMKFETRHPIAQIAHRRAVVCGDDGGVLELRDVGRNARRDIFFRRGVIVRTVLIKRRNAVRQHFLDPRRDGNLLRLHFGDCFRDAEHIPRFKRSRFVRETPFHRIVNGNDIVGDFGNPMRRVREILRGRVPDKFCGAVLLGDDIAQFFRERVVHFGIGDGIKEKFFGAFVFERAEIERVKFFLAAFFAHLFIKAVFRFVAQHAALDHRFQKFGRLQSSVRLIFGDRVV